MSRRVLVVEDDPDIGRLVMLQLAELGCDGRLIDDGVTALAEAQATRYDLVILDVMLPRLDGLQICRRLRASEHYTPILMLTSKSSELDRVLGLELGADDYLTKPFSMLELAARVKGVFRRADQAAEQKVLAQGSQRIEVDDLRIDLERHEAQVRGEPVELTAKEFALLEQLLLRVGEVVSKREIIEHVWDMAYDGPPNIVEVYVSALRRKLGAEVIETVRGAGYRLVAGA